jgi:hypothetical protein
VYDGTTTAVLATSGAALVGLVSGDTVNLNSGAVAGAFANKNVGSGKTVTVSGLTIDGVDAGNYSLAQPTTTADITKATLIATADDKTRVSGVSNPTFTVHYTGFVNGEGAGELDAPPTASTTADVNSPIGTYAIVLSGGHDNNYELTLVNGTLSVVAETLVLRIERVPATPGFVKVRVLAVGVPGRTYHLEASPVLPAGIWAEIASFKALADGSIAFIDNNAPIQPARFYRIRVP